MHIPIGHLSPLQSLNGPKRVTGSAWLNSAGTEASESLVAVLMKSLQPLPQPLRLVQNLHTNCRQWAGAGFEMFSRKSGQQGSSLSANSTVHLPSHSVNSHPRIASSGVLARITTTGRCASKVCTATSVVKRSPVKHQQLATIVHPLGVAGVSCTD